MAKEIIKILGQVFPLAATETTLYTVPAKRQCVISLLHAFVSGGANTVVDVAVVPKGGLSPFPATVAENYYIFQLPVTAKQEAQIATTKGLTLDEFDQIRVLTDVLGTVFQLYGVEIEG